MAARTVNRRCAAVLQVLPCALLILVAGHQLFLVYTQHLTPWHGGGFGMFSTIDDGLNRSLRVALLESGGQRTVEIPHELDEQSDRIQALPSERAMQRFASALALFYTAQGLSFTSLRVEVWRTHYTTKQMQPIDRLIADTKWPVNHGSP